MKETENVLEEKLTLTVKEANKLRGPGTRIYWRPEGSVLNPTDQDMDPAIVFHTSTPEDVEFSQKASIRHSKKAIY